MLIKFSIFIFLLLNQLQASFPEWVKEEILVLPDAGSSSITKAIKQTKYSIDLCLYHLDDERIINSLIKAKKKGVDIRIILNKPSLYPEPFSTLINKYTSEKLNFNNIQVTFLKNYSYTLTHYKFIIFDNNYGMVQTFNYDDFNLRKARNFGVFIKNSAQITALKKIFENDFKGQSFENDNLVKELYNTANIILGPVDQRKLIYNFLYSAKNSLYIYQQDISDPEIGNVLCQLRRNQKKINILMSPAPFGGIDNNRINQTQIQYLGGEYRFHSKEKLYIHAKVVLIDPEGQGKAYIGSCNFWPEALSRNRELGIIINDLAQVQAIFNVFKKDWENGLTYDEAISN